MDVPGKMSDHSIVKLHKRVLQLMQNVYTS